MQIAAKSTIVLILFYLLGLTAAGFWLERDYQETSREVMAETAELIAEQVANALREPIIDQLFLRDVDAFAELSEIVETTVGRSTLIKSLAVVDAAGDLVVGGKENLNYPTPEAKFGEDMSVQVISRFDGRGDSGLHIAYVPILRKGNVAGYTKMILGNKSILKLYVRLTNRLINFALIGLVSILILGALLHVELSRLGREIVRFMTDKSDIEVPIKKSKFGRDEFHDLRNEARLLGVRSLEQDNNLGLLSQALKVGLILVNRSGEPVFASPSALQLFVVDSKIEITQVAGEAWTKVQDAAEQLRKSSNCSVIFDADTVVNSNTRTLQFELLKSNDSVEHILVLIRDDNTVRALDDNLRAATRMHTLSSIYLGAAHDLRAPISAMVMNLELLEDSVVDDEQNNERGDQKRYINVLKDELQRLQRFLNSFLSSATVSQGGGREAVELTTIIEDLMRLLATQANQLGIKVEYKLPNNSVYVFASSEQIRQVIMNILVNAFEAMPDGGKLELQVINNLDNALVIITDSGAGIPSTLLDDIFEMHFTTKDSGTGIGLYVARNVIEKHGGSLTATSELGEGTEFTINLPLHTINEEDK